jgi:hypothetical protein
MLLVSCGGGNNIATPQVNCVDNIASSDRSNPDNIELQFLEFIDGTVSSSRAMEGVVVQLDHDGICVKSNSEGFVTFNALANGEHDIHIFSPKGYSWKSIYNIDTSAFYRFYLSKINNNFSNSTFTSYLSLKGSVTNINLGNSYSISLITDKGIKIDGRKSGVTLNSINNCEVDFELSLPVGSVINGDIIAYEYQYDSNSKESVLVDTATVSLASLTISTNEKPANYESYNGINDITFNSFGNKPVTTDMLSINRVVLPELSHLTYIDIGGYKSSGIQSVSKPDVSFFSFNDFYENPVFPRMYLSVDPFNFTDVYLLMMATQSDNYDKLWIYSKKYTKNTSAITVTPLITRLPVIQENQVGNLITWDEAVSNLTSLYLWIGNVVKRNTRTYWNLTLGSNASSVRLPNIPNGVTSMLNTGINYELSLNGAVDNSSATKFESFRVNNKTWKP